MMQFNCNLHAAGDMEIVMFYLLYVYGSRALHSWLGKTFTALSPNNNPVPVIISMTKLLDSDWLRGVQLFH